MVLHGGNDPANQWAELCLREADLVVAVTTGVPDAEWLRRATALQGCELLVLGPSVTGNTLGRLQPREVQVVAQPSRRRKALELTARRIAGRALGIVLSGGGARAFAHFGVLEELREAGLQFDRVAGVSLGSLVGAAMAAGSEAEIPRLGETILRTVTVSSIDTVAAARLHSELVITPRVERIGLMDWKALPRAVEVGRQAAREALEANPELLGRLGS